MSDIDTAAEAVVQALLTLADAHQASVAAKQAEWEAAGRPGSPAAFDAFDAFTRALRAMPAEDRERLKVAADAVDDQLNNVAKGCFDFEDLEPGQG